MGKLRGSKKTIFGNPYVTAASITISFIVILIICSNVNVLAKYMVWTGFGNQETRVDFEKNGKDLKNIEPVSSLVIKQDYKNLWDWLQFSGVVAIPFMIFLYQHNQNKQADTISREDALLTYFKHISELLIDKKLKNLLEDNQNLKDVNQKSKDCNPKLKNETTILDPALDVVHACTLSVLRRLGNDGERKGRIMRFLSDAELINSPLCLELADLSCANLTNVKLKGANLVFADLSQADLSLTDERITKKCNKEPVKIIMDLITHCYIKDSETLNSLKDLNCLKDFKCCETAILTESRKVILDFVDLKPNLYCAKLTDAILKKRFLLCANLTNVDLTDANLSDAILINTCFSGANLINTCFSGANLEGANLEGANLEGANLKGANLEGANLKGANLKGANLEGANLKGAKNLTPDQVKEARNCNTNLSRGIISSASKIIKFLPNLSDLK